MTNKHISLAPVPASGTARDALAEKALVDAFRTETERAEALRMLERTQLLSLWAEGLDTKDISSRVNRQESFVYNTLSKLRQRARVLT